MKRFLFHGVFIAFLSVFSITTLKAETLQKSNLIVKDSVKNRLYYPMKWELTTNITLSLSRFAGNLTRNLNDDPYMIMLRKMDQKGKGFERGHNWRMGYNGFQIKSQDELGGGQSRNTQDLAHSLLIGREWRRQLDQGFYVFGGFETRFMYQMTESRTLNRDIFPTTEFITTRTATGGSVDAFGGLGWRFNQRLSIYTEASLVGQALKIDRSFENSGVVTSLQNSMQYQFIPLVPIALFMSFSF